MVEIYLLGVICAILSGVVAALGNILQKSAVNKIPREKDDENIMGILIKSPSWIIGSILCYGVSTIFIVLAQFYIGPALIPGLYAAGLIVLAIGSAKLIGEGLSLAEYIAILIIIVGVFLIGLSKLDIPVNEIKNLDYRLLIRMALFSFILIFLWFLITIAVNKDINRKGIALAIAGGILFSLAGIHLFFLLIVANFLFKGEIQAIYIIILIAAIGAIAFGNYLGIKQTQEAYKYAQASKVQPTQEVPKQIIAICIYFLLFLKITSIISVFYILFGVSLVICAGFILGNRQDQLEDIDKKAD
ncbi:MAG: hypothetical protein EU529_08265 [Promethearchaeota archaeon]|nr:MAG: hypothetical protein EU529_08265 [Candidatus Lokiarchaeota archaeon]